MKTAVQVWRNALLVVYARKDRICHSCDDTVVCIFEGLPTCKFSLASQAACTGKCMEGWQGSDRASGDHSVLAGERGKKGKGGQGSGREGRVLPF